MRSKGAPTFRRHSPSGRLTRPSMGSIRVRIIGIGVAPDLTGLARGGRQRLGGRGR